MSERTQELVPLSKHVHFVRALAGLPRIAVGIAAGATLFGISGCSSCNGSYGAIPPPQRDAVANHEPRDAKADGEHTDGGAASTEGGHTVLANVQRVPFNCSTTALAGEYRRIEAAFERPEHARPALNPTAHAPALLERARDLWTTAAGVEYTSASTFMEIAARLREIGDPVDVQVIALRMAQDELRHATICGRVARAMGSSATVLQPNEDVVAAHSDCGPEENVLRFVIFGCCLSEMVNAARLAKQYAETSDPFVRDAYRSLLADERLHAQFGFSIEHRAEWLRERPLLREFADTLSQVRLRRAGAPDGRRPGGRAPTDGRRARHRPTRSTDLSASYQETITNATVPALERFGIDAEHAWRTRSLTP